MSCIRKHAVMLIIHALSHGESTLATREQCLQLGRCQTRVPSDPIELHEKVELVCNRSLSLRSCIDHEWIEFDLASFAFARSLVGGKW